VGAQEQGARLARPVTRRGGRSWCPCLGRDLMPSALLGHLIAGGRVRCGGLMAQGARRLGTGMFLVQEEGYEPFGSIVCTRGQ
jgi:hypothetical protein